MTLEAQLRALIRDAVKEELRAVAVVPTTPRPANDTKPAPSAPMTTAQATTFAIEPLESVATT